MSETKHVPQPHEKTNSGNAGHSHGPYWKRAHRDWRIWCFVVLMLVAMGVYIMTGDLRWSFHGQPGPPVPAAVGN